MKKFLIIVLIVMLVLGMMACGKSAQENLVEQIMEQAAAESGEDVDIDIDSDGDGGSMTISNGDEEMVIESDSDGVAWPTDKLPSSVPKMDGVKVVAVQALSGMVTVYFEECDASEAQVYVTAIKTNGWEIITEINMEGAQQIQAQIGEEWLQFTWAEEDGAGWVSYSTGE